MAENTIKQKCWWGYPCLKQWDDEIEFRTKYSFAKLKIGVQDGFYVTGYDYQVGPGSAENSYAGGCNPGRKWGEFSSREQAVRESLKWIVHVIKERQDRDNVKSWSREIIEKIEQKIAETYCKQLELF